MPVPYLIGIFLLAVLVVHFKEAWADFCVRVAGTMIVLGVLVQIVRSILAG